MSAPPTIEQGALIQAQAQQLERLQAQLEKLDARTLELENEVVRRGIKLSCANVALARAKIAFDETSQARESAVQDIAHDLRTPLTSIKGAAQNLLDGMVEPLTPGVREYVEIVQQQSERLIAVVNWLVDAMRLTTGPIDLDGEPVDLAALVERTVRGVTPIADERQIAMRVECCETLVRADEPKLQQVLENLLGNALKFTNSGGRVTVTMGRDGTGNRVCVADTGVGMDEQTIERVFDRYYRKPSAEAGKGLGLLISREIARKHGGDITVTSQPGVGSEFVLRLPLLA